MKPEYIAHVHELTTTLTLLCPVLVSIGVLNFPTVDVYRSMTVNDVFNLVSRLLLVKQTPQTA